MAYAQWIEVKIRATSFTISVKNANLPWGKFYRLGNKDQEISTDDINKITITSGNSATICSCGRADASAGTEGSFDLYDGDTKVGTYRWDCPWGSKTNSFGWDTVDDDKYTTEATGGNTDSGSIGNVTIKCVKT
jgi:hypothetical protein